MIHGENTHYGESTQPRKNARRRHLPLRSYERDGVARRCAEPPRQLDAEHDSVFARPQRIEAACFHVAAKIGNLLL